jgi:hypothetical protein
VTGRKVPAEIQLFSRYIVTRGSNEEAVMSQKLCSSVLKYEAGVHEPESEEKVLP